MTRSDSTSEALRRELASGFSATAGQEASAVGLVSGNGVGPLPPRACLETCLQGQLRNLQTHGCDWLRAAARGELDDSRLRNGVCARGFCAAGREVRAGGAPVVLLTVSRGPEDPALRGSERLTQFTLRAVERVAQLLEENVGLADEVLRTYEQLNLVFDLTQRIARVTDVQEIERILLLRIGELVQAERICIARSNGARRSYKIDGHELMPAHHWRWPGDDVTQRLAEVRESGQGAVHQFGDYEMIAAPLVRLDEQVDVIVGWRRNRSFHAGDVLILDSVLSFVGQLVSNSELHERLMRMSRDVTLALVNAIDKKDHYTSGHSERVGFLSRLIGERLGLAAAELQVLEWSGLLHDVGKIGVPEEILNKPGKLSDEEFDVIKRHPVMGYEILKPIASFQNVLEGVLYHHENPDGTGYPEGLTGESIPLFPRIIHVADVFDALSTTRSYRAAFTIDQAMEIIRNDAGTKFDSEVVGAFLEAFARLPEKQPAAYERMFGGPAVNPAANA